RCSRATWVPVRRSAWRRKSESSLRVGAAAVCNTSLTRRVISTSGSADRASASVPGVCVPSVIGSVPRCDGGGAGGGLGEDAGDQDADEHSAVLRAGVDVGLGVDVLASQVGSLGPGAVLGGAAGQQVSE